MKRCPNCNRTYGDENDYCLEDGTPLSGGGSYGPRDETPTQVVRTPVYGAPAAPQTKWAYPVIGALCGIVIVLGFIVFFKDRGAGNNPQKNSSENNRTEAQQTPDNKTPTPIAQGASPTLPPLKQLANSTVTVDSPRDGYLALKEGPCITPCRTLAKIPHGTTINLGTCRENIETADRRRGHWCNTSYAGYSGWIFDAFVAP